MKKFIAAILCILVFTAALPVIYAANDGVEMTNPQVEPSGGIQPNQYFLLTMDLTKTDEAQNIYMEIIDGDFIITDNSNGNNTKKYNIVNGWNTNACEASVPMKYNGGSNTILTIVFKYKTAPDSQVTETKRYYIPINAIPQAPATPPPYEVPDTRESQPILTIANTAMPIATAGYPFTLFLTISNTTFHYAKDITITPEYAGSGSSPFQFSTMKQSAFIAELKGYESSQVELKYNIAPNTPEGVYPLLIKFHYSNVFDDEYGRGGEISELIHIKIENSGSQPTLRITGIDTPIGGLQAGEVSAVSLGIKNYGNLTAVDTKITIENLGNGSFALQGATNPFYAGNISGGKDYALDLKLAVPENAETGSYDLKIKIEYKDHTGNTYTEQQQLFLNVVGKETPSPTPTPTPIPLLSELQLKNITAPSRAIQVDEDFNISLDLANTGEAKLYNVKISLGSDGVIIPKSAPIKAYPVLEPGKSHSLTFTFAPTREAVTRNYPISIQVDYEIEQNGERKPQSLVQYTGVLVSNPVKEEDEEKPEPTPKTVPKIIIDTYSTEPTIVRAGENFSLMASFTNTSGIKAIQNIKVFFTVNESSATSGSVFSPVNSSNTFYIDYIGPKESVETNLVFYTIPDAQPKTYTITANFEYEDEEGNTYTATELIGIPVVQKSRLETGNIQLPPSAMMGQPLPLFFEFYNMGKVTLYNLMIKIEGDFTAQTGNLFVGNFEPGYTDYFDTTLFPNATGLLTGYIVFSYDDAAGEPQEIRKEFTVQVDEMPEDVFNPEFPGGDPGMYPGIEDPAQQQGILGLIRKPYVWIPAAVVVLLIITLIIRKIIRKRKDRRFDE